MNHLKLSRFILVTFIVYVMAFAGLAIAHLSASEAKNHQPTVRAVYLGGATLTPTNNSDGSEASGKLPESATMTVVLETSGAVVEGTVATVELTEEANVGGISYLILGGQKFNGRTWEVRLRGGGQSETIKYTIFPTETKKRGSVQFNVALRSAMNPPHAPLPAATVEEPRRFTQGLTLPLSERQTAIGIDAVKDDAVHNVAPLKQKGSCESNSNKTTPCFFINPILVDVLGNGLSLSDARSGVDFDFDSDGYAHRMSWTNADTDDAWLALDRNGDGKITLGAELFGSFTPQPASPNRNGFAALAEFDKAENGGNSDGVIDQRDAVFEMLRLWQDKSHNGVSELYELHTLPELGVRMIELRYKESPRTDEYGNQFRYRAKVWSAHDSKAGRWAWDVFLVR